MIPFLCPKVPLILFSRLFSMATSTEPLKDCVEIVEGKAKIQFPKGEVFYNPVQVFNRDLSVAVIDHYSKHFWKPDKRIRQSVPFWRKEGGAVKDDVPTDIGENNEAMELECESVDQVSPPIIDQKSPIIDHKSLSVDQKLTSVDQKSPPVDQGSSCLDPRKQKYLTILDALSASGLRSMRYALEVPLAGKITANDISSQAHQSIINNIRVNGVADKVAPSLRDASLFMYECIKSQSNDRYDVVDIDPYGSPSLFLDSAVQACHDGGLLCVTCTDTSVLCGNHSETCHAKYGSMSIKSKYCHEMALRIILACIESHANRYRRYIVPVLSCSVDFYCRVFVLVYTSALEVKKSPSKLAMVYHCNGCSDHYLQPLGRTEKKDNNKSGLKFANASGPPVGEVCTNCGSTFKFGGPIWSDPIHDAHFLKGLINTAKSSGNEYKTMDRMEGLVTMASEELPDCPLYYVMDELCSVLHCNSIKMGALRSAILDQGYSVSLSHTNRNAIKTNAPRHVIWDIMRCWVKQNPIKNIKPDSPASKILQQESKIEASFNVRSDAFPLSKVLNLARFPENPERNWGPKSRAKRKLNGSPPSNEKKKDTQ